MNRIPRTVWVLGFVSMLMDISSEMIHSLLPVFMVTVLAASIVAGVLWDQFGAAATFYAGGGFAALTLLLLLARHIHLLLANRIHY